MTSSSSTTTDATVEPLTVVSAGVLHLFVTLSTPIINKLPLYNIRRNGSYVGDFGVLGACYIIPFRRVSLIPAISQPPLNLLS